MKGWIVYDAFGAERNRWFCDRMIEHARENGMQLVLRIAPIDFSAYEEELKEIGFAVVRTIDPTLNKRFEERGIRAFNNYATSLVANDKWRIYTLCRELNIPVMHTAEGEGGLPYPYVLKSVDGCAGKEVFLIRSEEDLVRCRPLLAGKRCISQEFCSDPGTDMRVYALGGEILACILRHSDTDFRSNFSLGGDVRTAECTEGQRKIMRTLTKKLGCDLVGVDFIVHRGEWILNEIEDVVGTRMLYKCTDIDVTKEYIRYIASELHIPNF